jgi:hypothetical protein
LKYISIPDSVETIGAAAFYYCRNLKRVTIPSSLTSFGQVPFSNCSALKIIIFEGDAPSCDELNFINNETSTLICYTMGTLGWGPTFFGQATHLWEQDFTYTITLEDTITITGHTGENESVEIPEIIYNQPVTSIETRAFEYDNSLITLHIPNSVTNIGSSAFSGCDNLTSITLPNLLTSIASHMFTYSKLSNITIPDSVTRIGDSAFFGSDLRKVTLSDTLTDIEPYAFGLCEELMSITIPRSVTNIEAYAFYACTSITNLSVEDQNTNYSSLDGVFFNKDQDTLIAYPIGRQKTAYAIPNSVTEIDVYAFGEAENLTDVTIPNSVTTISDNAFKYCYELKSIYCMGSAPNLGANAFYNIDAQAIVYYLAGASGWGSTYGGIPTQVWPAIQTTDSIANVNTNGFSFNLPSGPDNVQVVVEASTNIVSGIWEPVATNTLSSGTALFTDPQATNLTHRYYRITMP